MWQGGVADDGRSTREAWCVMLRTVLLSLGIPALMTAVAIPVALATGAWGPLAIFTCAAIVFAATSGGAHRWLPGAADVSTASRLNLVALCWLQVAVTLSVVTWLAFVFDSPSGPDELADPLSAMFETVSGLSTTGLSMLDDSALAEPWLQWWRSVLQWFGAIGVVVFAATVAEPSGDHDTLVGSEWGDAPSGGAGETIRRLFVILGSVTVASIGAMIAVGEPAWRAVNHGMAAAATGGFTITSDSAGSSSAPARMVLAITVLISALSFGTIWDRARREGVPLWKRTQVRYGLGVTVLGVAVALAVADGVAVGDVVFNAISASTTAGFSSGTSFQSIEALAGVAMVAMFVGGAAGSTAGGIKAARLAWLTKAAARWLPGETDFADDPYLWDGQDIECDDARLRIMGAASIVVTWLSIVAAAAVALAVHNPTVPISDLLFEVFSAGSGVGLSSGVADHSNDATTKVVLSAVMLAGRVEMTAFVVLIASPFFSGRGD